MEWEATNAKPRFRERQKAMTTIEYVVMLVLVAVLIAFTSPGISNALWSVFKR